jgi:ATP-dependent Zn protease
LADVTTGASDDLRRTTRVARSMITECHVRLAGQRTLAKGRADLFGARDFRAARLLRKVASRLTERSRRWWKGIIAARSKCSKRTATNSRYRSPTHRKKRRSKPELNAIVGIAKPEPTVG